MKHCDPQQARASAEKYFREGYDCVEAMVRAFHDLGVVPDQEAAVLFPVVRGFGKGMGATRGPCGALSGAVIVLGSVFGASQNQRRMYRITGRFTRIFEKDFGAIPCREVLRATSLDCCEKTGRTAELLAEYLNRKTD